MRLIPRGAAILWLGLVLIGGYPLAPAKAQFARPDTAVPSAQVTAEPSLWGRTVAWLFTQQRQLQRQLTVHMRELSEQRRATAAGGLIFASFLYGVFHAAGPGHGKAVLSTYLLTHRQRMGRGVKLAIAAAFCQGAVALAIVYGLISIAGWLPRETQSAVAWSERASFALVTAIGAWLVFRALRAVLNQRRHVHGHQGHAQDGSCGCGHAHAPTAQQVNEVSDLRTAVGVVLSIGLRPCSGAVIVLVVAQVFALHWAGVGAVLAMSAGTAITMASLAFFAVHARQWATRAAAGATGRRTVALASLAMMLGGLLIVSLGASLLAASFGPAHPLGL